MAMAPVPVRFPEGSLHGFLALSTPKEDLIASGDLLQVGRDGEIKSRPGFHFKDKSGYEETETIIAWTTWREDQPRIGPGMADAPLRSLFLPEDARISAGESLDVFRLQPPAAVTIPTGVRMNIAAAVSAGELGDGIMIGV